MNGELKEYGNPLSALRGERPKGARGSIEIRHYTEIEGRSRRARTYEKRLVILLQSVKDPEPHDGTASGSHNLVPGGDVGRNEASVLVLGLFSESSLYSYRLTTRERILTI